MIGNFFQEEKSYRHANEAWFSNKKDKIFAQLILFERRNERIVSKCVVKLNSCVSIVCQIARFLKFKTWYLLYVRSTQRVYKELRLSIQNQYFIKIRFRSSFKICYKSKMKFISTIALIAAIFALLGSTLGRTWPATFGTCCCDCIRISPPENDPKVHCDIVCPKGSLAALTQ